MVSRRPLRNTIALTDVYPSLGYDIHVLPKVSVAERADWMLSSLAR